MSRFEDHLWREVVRQHGPDLELARRPPTKHGRPRPRLLAGTTIGLAGAGTALALVLGAASSSPAFAVTQNRDGTVTVKILRSAGITGANTRLHELGVRARVVATPPPGGICTVGSQTAVQTAVQGQGASASQQAILVARLNPRKIRAGQTLVLAPPAGRQDHSGNSGKSGNSGNRGATAQNSVCQVPVQGQRSGALHNQTLGGPSRQ